MRGKPPYMCDKCGKVFPKAQAYRYHMETHDGDQNCEVSRITPTPGRFLKAQAPHPLLKAQTPHHS